MDSSIALPGGLRIGWDGIIGLVPGLGDIAGLGVSLYIIAGAYRAGASISTLLRMLINVGIETIVGAVPLLGDLFDMAFKANTRNMRLLERQFEDASAVSVQSSRRIWLLALGSLLIIATTLYAIVTLLTALLRWLF